MDMKKIQILLFMLMFSHIGFAFSETIPNETPSKISDDANGISEDRNPLIIAHRGGAADGPENTIPTIESSIHAVHTLFGSQCNYRKIVFQYFIDRVI